MMFMFKKCRNGDNCPWAHDLKELDGEYKPNGIGKVPLFNNM